MLQKDANEAEEKQMGVEGILSQPATRGPSLITNKVSKLPFRFYTKCSFCSCPLVLLTELITMWTYREQKGDADGQARGSYL